MKLKAGVEIFSGDDVVRYPDKRQHVRDNRLAAGVSDKLTIFYSLSIPHTRKIYLYISKAHLDTRNPIPTSASPRNGLFERATRDVGGELHSMRCEYNVERVSSGTIGDL